MPKEQRTVEKPHMPTHRSAGEKAQEEVEALVARALTEPGVAEAVEVYERAESVYTALSAATRVSESAANSTGEEWLGRG